jgi:hypothetical protein
MKKLALWLTRIKRGRAIEILVDLAELTPLLALSRSWFYPFRIVIFWVAVAVALLIKTGHLLAEPIRLLADWVETGKFKRGLRELQRIIDAN